MPSEVLSKSARIAELNDEFRKTGKGGKTLMTNAVAHLPVEIFACAARLRVVRPGISPQKPPPAPGMAGIAMFRLSCSPSP
jgi:hypothetical protein